MSDLIISVSGLRGIVGETLTPEVAIRYACAFAEETARGTDAGPVIVARDSRPSGRMLAEAIHAGLNAAGRNTLDAGVAATPTVGVLVREHHASGAIQISASHNPSPYNGMKLFSTEGRVIPGVLGAKVLDRYHTGRIAWARHDGIGSRENLIDTTSAHLHAVLDTVDVAKIRSRAFRVLLDANHGAGAKLGRRLLEELGCTVTILGEMPDGQFEHTPEPTSENLAAVCATVKESNADIGFCQDPDADRLAVIDADGRYIGEEYTVALCVEHVLRRTPGAIVTNCSSSRMAQDLAERARSPVFRSAVGEANVVDAMLAHNAVFGGEGNGGPIDPRVGLVRDSFVGMARILDSMATTGEPVAQLADALPRYEIVKAKMTLAKEKIPPALAALAKHFDDAQSNTLDGLRLDWPGRWLLVRGSNTEPIVRVIAEAQSAVVAQKMCDEAAAVMAQV